MKHAHRNAGDTDSDHHQAKLADGGVGEDALEVELAKRNERRDECGDRAHPGNKRQYAARLEQRERPCHEKHAGCNHRRRVNQGTDRRRPLHGIRQPNVKRYLAGLTYGPDEQQKANHRCSLKTKSHLGIQIVLLENSVFGFRIKIKCPGDLERQQYPDKETHVADARDDERLLASGCGFRFVIPKTDQQVGRHADNLPAHEKEDQAVGQHHPKHAGGEQREVAEETGHPFVVRHVAG